MGDLKKIKITNAFWLGKVAPFIAEFLKKVEMIGVTYEGLYTYFANTVQNGDMAKQQGVRDRGEFWVVMDDTTPIAFAHWFVKGLPFFGTVHCDFIYSWQRKKDPANLLLDEYQKFGEDHRAQFWEADATNRAVFEVLKRACGKRGMEVQETGQINFMVWRKQ